MASAPGVLLFDDGTGDLGPLSDLRASFEQRTGGLALLERVGAGGEELVRGEHPLHEEEEPVVRPILDDLPGGVDRGEEGGDLGVQDVGRPLVARTEGEHQSMQ